MKSFFPALGELLKAYQKNDPAFRSSLEVLLLYPGVKAWAIYRMAHALNGLGLPFLPRMMSEGARLFTGIDIHPGARIGDRVVMDHGLGIVIGETAVVGNDVLIYQGVTLGG